MQDFLLEFSSRTNNQIEAFRKEAEQFNAHVKSDMSNLQNQIDRSINDCTRNTSNELTYTNKYFNTQIAESETKLLNQNNQLLNILIEISNKNNFQFESVKECCIVQSNNMKSIITTLQKIINTSFYDLENSNRQSLEVIGNALTRLSENINVSESKLQSETGTTARTANEKSFKMIKSYMEEQKSNILEEKMNMLDSKLNLLLDTVNRKNSQ